MVHVLNQNLPESAALRFMHNHNDVRSQCANMRCIYAICTMSICVGLASTICTFWTRNSSSTYFCCDTFKSQQIKHKNEMKSSKMKCRRLSPVCNRREPEWMGKVQNIEFVESRFNSMRLVAGAQLTTGWGQRSWLMSFCASVHGPFCVLLGLRDAHKRSSLRLFF